MTQPTKRGRGRPRKEQGKLSRNGYTNYLRSICAAFVEQYHPDKYAKFQRQAEQEMGIEPRPHTKAAERMKQALSQ